MKIFEYLMRKRLFGESLNAMEETVLVNLIKSDPKVKAIAAHWWQQWIEVQTIGGTMADVFYQNDKTCIKFERKESKK